MTLSLSFRRSSGWVIPVTILSVVLGMLIAAALKTQQNIRQSSMPSSRYSGLAAAYLDEKSKNALLEKRLGEIRSQLDMLKNDGSTGTAKTKLLQKELSKYKITGFCDVEGPGVEVILNDYPADRVPADLPPIIRDQYNIHDIDLRDIVNELYVNGAEAVSIQDADTEQRLIASSSIRCVGGPIQVNNVNMSPRFIIKAIGPPNTMQKGLTMTGGLIDNLRPNVVGISSQMISVKRKDNIVIPAYSGDITSQYVYAKEADHGKETR